VASFVYSPLPRFPCDPATALCQTFTRVDTPSLSAADDARFEYFRDRVLPVLEAGLAPGGGASHTLVFVPSYFDYVRLRNLFDARVRRVAESLM
jgi:hypothetical protein